MQTLRLPLLLLALLLLLWHLLPEHTPDLADWTGWIGVSLPLMLAALAQTQIILAGGQGLAAGSTALFINALLVTQVGATTGSLLLWMLLGPLVGVAIGAANGLLIGYLRLSSTAVTLATSFAIGGTTIVLLEQPAPMVPEDLRTWLLGDLVAGLPVPFLLLALLLLLAVILDRSRFGRAVRAVGAVEPHARPAPTLLAAYSVAGLGYGLSGVFLSAQLGTADPLLGGPTLAEIYAAVALGGSIPLIRQGSTLGSLIAALAVAATVNLLTPLHWQEYTPPALAGVLLIVGLGVAARRGWPGRWAVAEGPGARPGAWWLAGTVGLVAVATLASGGAPLALLSNDLLIVALALGFMAVAQSAVIMTGQLDLSLPTITAVSGLALVSLAQGSNDAGLWVLPLVLLAGAGVGLLGGALAQILGAPRVLVTLALGGLLQAFGVYLIFARPTGFAPTALTGFIIEAPGGFSLAVLTLTPLLLAMILLLRSARLRPHLAALAATRQGKAGTAALLHGFAGLLAAAAGILLAGYGGGFRLGIVDIYLLPMLLAAALAGLRIGRPGGDPLGLLLSVPLVVAGDTLLVAMNLSSPARVAVMGLCLLAVVALQGRGRVFAKTG